MSKKICPLLFFIFLSATINICYGQITFQKDYTTATHSISTVNKVQQLSNGDYIILGNITDNANISDIFLEKINANGDSIWTKTFGGPNDDFGMAFQQTYDGGFIVAGYTSSFGAGNVDVYLIKTDSNGDPVWNKTFGGIRTDMANDIQQCTDSGFVIVGWSSSFKTGTGNGGDVYLIKTTMNGDTMWTRNFGGAGEEEGHSIRQTSDHGFIISGITGSYGIGGDVYLVKLDYNGNMVWSKAYGGQNWEDGLSVEQTAEGGFIVAGFTYSFGAGNTDIYMLKTDSLGALTWSKTIGRNSGDKGDEIHQMPDGGYILAGGISNDSTSMSYLCLFKIDQAGDTVWTKAVSTYDGNYAGAFYPCNDGGYIAACTNWLRTGTIIKTDSLGNFGCNEYNMMKISTSPLTTVTPAVSNISSTNTTITNPALMVGSGIQEITNCSSLNVQETKQSPPNLIYPNPSSTELNILSPSGERPESISVSIINLLGDMVLKVQGSDREDFSIDIRMIPKGVYIVKVEYGICRSIFKFLKL